VRARDSVLEGQGVLAGGLRCRVRETA